MPNVLVTTTDEIPSKQYEILQMLTVSFTKLASADFSLSILEMKKQAASIGADAVVGFHAVAFTTSAKSIMQSAYGTAVRYI